jgi:hypothetical protein
MQKSLLAFLLVTTCASAQTAKPSISDWTRVQVLPMGTQVHIKTQGHGSVRCAVSAADASSVTCGGVVFERSTVKYIKSRHRVRSTLVGVGLGYGTAAGITAAYAEGCKLNCSEGSAVAIGVLDLGLLVATPVVFGVYDLTAGTIYKAP